MSENKENKLIAKEKREIIRRTLKAVNAADKGYVARDTIKYCIDLSVCSCNRRNSTVQACRDFTDICGDSCGYTGNTIRDTAVFIQIQKLARLCEDVKSAKESLAESNDNGLYSS